MRICLIITVALLLFSLSSPAQVVTGGEYFYDTDPGLGNAVPLTGFIPSALSIKAFNIPTVGLSYGDHQLYIRTVDDKGIWSVAETQTITITPGIDYAEYFFDTDPGQGNGQHLNLSLISDLIVESFNIPTEGLSPGDHILYIRTHDLEGKWSVSEPVTITVTTTIVYGEYFFDTDPGQGNGLPTQAFVSGDSVIFNQGFPTTGLTKGIHQLYVRLKDLNGVWSVAEPRVISVLPSVVAAEYFFDTDPGQGAGIPLTGFTPDDSLVQVLDISTIGLNPGIHTLYIRTLDSEGIWSVAEARTITINPSLIAAEYFYDTDPGQGNGTPITDIGGFDDTISFNLTFNTAGLSYGDHVIYIRTKDSEGIWSVAEGTLITIVPSIVQAEYFYDTDNGFANPVDIINFSYSDSVFINVNCKTDGLSEGPHYLYFRTKDYSGIWSVSEPRLITVTSSLQAAEYFYDTDPGTGNGIPINNFQADLDSVNINYLFPTYGLSEGDHTLYVRIRDSKGIWSIAEPTTITIRNNSAAYVKLFIEGYYTGNGNMMAVYDPAGMPSVCDKVTIGFVEPFFPYNVAYQEQTFVSVTGEAILNLPESMINSNYYIFVKGRNIIETWSREMITITSYTLYDFTYSVN